MKIVLGGDEVLGAAAKVARMERVGTTEKRGGGGGNWALQIGPYFRTLNAMRSVAELVRASRPCPDVNGLCQMEVFTPERSTETWPK